MYEEVIRRDRKSTNNFRTKVTNEIADCTNKLKEAREAERKSAERLKVKLSYST